MISKSEQELLSYFIGQIPTYEDLGGPSLEQSELQDWADELDEDNIGNWLRFFVANGDGDPTRLSINTDRFVEELCETLYDETWLESEPEFDELSSGNYNITLTDKVWGEITLYLSTSGDDVSAFDTSFQDKKLLIYTVEPDESVRNRNSSYPWEETLTDDFLNDIRAEFNRILGADSIDICSRKSPAYTNEPEGVIDSVSFYAETLGLDADSKPARDERARITNYIDQGSVADYLKSGESWIVVCNCELTNETLHCHQFVDSEPVDPETSTMVTRLRKRARDNLKNYNDWYQDKEEVGPALRVILAVMIVSGVVQTLPIGALQYFNIDVGSQSISLFFLAAGGLYILISILLMLYLLAPRLRFNRHKWEGRSLLEYVSHLLASRNF